MAMVPKPCTVARWPGFELFGHRELDRDRQFERLAFIIAPAVVQRWLPNLLWFLLCRLFCFFFSEGFYPAAL